MKIRLHCFENCSHKTRDRWSRTRDDGRTVGGSLFPVGRPFLWCWCHLTNATEWFVNANCFCSSDSCYFHYAYLQVCLQLPTSAENVTLHAILLCAMLLRRPHCTVTPDYPRYRSISPARRAHSSKRAVAACSIEMTGNGFLHSNYLPFPCSQFPFLPIPIPKFKSYSHSHKLFPFPSHYSIPKHAEQNNKV